MPGKRRCDGSNDHLRNLHVNLTRDQSATLLIAYLQLCGAAVTEKKTCSTTRNSEVATVNPTKRTRIPKFRHHKATGQAYVELNGHRYYLGRYDSADSRQQYDALLTSGLPMVVSCTFMDGSRWLN